MDLGFLGPAGPLAQFFLLCLGITSIVVFIRAWSDARWWPIFFSSIAIVIWDRSFDVWCDKAGCYGGGFGLEFLTWGLSEPEIVSLVGSIMALGAFTAGYVVLHYSGDLKLKVLIFAAYTIMLIPYGLAVIGEIEGGTALAWVNGIGLVKLAIIFVGGGLSLAHDRRDLLHRSSILAHGLDFVASPRSHQKGLARSARGPGLP